jgi:hypothetical protein
VRLLKLLKCYRAHRQYSYLPIDFIVSRDCPLKAVACCSQFEYRRNKEEGGYVVRVDLGGDKAEASTLSLINVAHKKFEQNAS